MISIILAAAAAATVPPSPREAPPVPMPETGAPPRVLFPFDQSVYHPIPEDQTVSIDFQVAESGEVGLCIARIVRGRLADLTALPTNCPSKQVEIMRDGDGNPVSRNVSVISSVLVSDAK